ncbi:MAG: NAD kinase [Prevotella sp.]|nr:NAD kinase [Prevotella sp.]
MTPRKLNFAIFGNTFQAKKSSAIRNVLASLETHGAGISVDREYHDFLLKENLMKPGRATVFDGDGFEADFVISMGGDGTFLKAAGRVGPKAIPVIGVNMGRLGFLADVGPGEFDDVVGALHHGCYTVENRVVIMVETDGEPLAGCNCALNDVAILKRDNASMISIHTSINGEYLTTFQADGLVVSTPTGSTAYSLSNCGPIIVPGTHVLAMTAVAPHSLNIRPIVISDDSEITLAVESRSHNFLVAVDGRSEKCCDVTRLTLRKAPYGVKIVKRNGTRYFDTLRHKMMWGKDLRI